MAQQVVLEIGDAGRAVIVGRGSAYYLANREDVFHVFVLELAQTVDRDRAPFIRRCFSIEWPSRHLFNVMVNSSVGDEAAVETILNMAAPLAMRRAIVARSCCLQQTDCWGARERSDRATRTKRQLLLAPRQTPRATVGASECVGESEGRSPSDKNGGVDEARTRDLRRDRQKSVRRKCLVV